MTDDGMSPTTLRRYRALLRLLPDDFREEYGPEMLETFLARHQEAVGSAQRIRLWRRETWALLRTGSILRRNARRKRSRSHTSRSPVSTGRERDGMGTLTQDLRYAVRTILKNPGFSIVAIVTLALGIGANAAIFTVVNGVLLRPLPFPEPDRLVRVYGASPGRGYDRMTFSHPDFEDWDRRSTQIESMGIWWPNNMVLTGGDRGEEVVTAFVSAGFFETLGVSATLGRTLRDDEYHGNNRVVVLSHDFWTRSFGADPTRIGSSITLDQGEFEVVGVMPQGFGYPSPDTEIWSFISVIPQDGVPHEQRFVRFTNSVARLAPGATVQQARAELTSIAAALESEYPDSNAGLDAATVIPLQDTIVGDVSTALLVLLGAVGFILLIACVNVANLLLARGTARRKEIAIRSAMGAARSRVIRQMLTESGLLALLGGAAGLLTARVLVSLLVDRSAGILPRTGEVGIDGTVLLFALLVSLATAVVFGTLPALSGSRTDLQPLLKEGGRTSAGSGAGRRAPRALVSVEVGLALILLVGAGLLTRSLLELQRVDPGFDPDGVLVVSFTISEKQAGPNEFLPFYHEFLNRMERLPGVESVGSIRSLPLQGTAEQIGFEVPGAFERPQGEQPSAELQQISPDLFRTLRIPLLAGRTFTEADASGDLSVIISETLARDYFGDLDPVGRTIRVGGEVPVIGVVGDVRQTGLGDAPLPTVYVPQEQVPRIAMSVAIRTSVDPLSLAGAVRAEMEAMDRDQPIRQITPLDQIVSESVAQPRFFTLLLLGFSGLALALATVGVYGVISYHVGQRRHELGLRMALGASRREAIGLALRHGMGPAVVGIGFGLVAAITLSRLLSSLVFGISVLDPGTYLIVALVLAGVALLACWVPAARAGRVDPATVLRYE